MFPDPVVLESKAPLPIPTQAFAVVLESKAPDPTATLPVPVVFSSNA